MWRPHASCKHVAALCYALVDFSRFRHLPEFFTCTDKLQEWNRPRPKRLDIIPVADLSSQRLQILRKNPKTKLPSPSTYDPRPLEHRSVRLDALEKLRCDLLSLNQPCAFLDILVPPAKWSTIIPTHFLLLLRVLLTQSTLQSQVCVDLIYHHFIMMMNSEDYVIMQRWHSMSHLMSMLGSKLIPETSPCNKTGILKGRRESNVEGFCTRKREAYLYLESVCILSHFRILPLHLLLGDVTMKPLPYSIM